MQKQVPLLQVCNYSLAFRKYEKGLKETKWNVVRRLNITIHEGEIVAVVGASGSGKSLLANAILGILPHHAISGGEIYYKGELLTKERQVKLRGKEITLIPQSVTALDPLMKVGKQVEQVISNKNSREMRTNIFKQVGLPTGAENKYPFELSGGMNRRVLAASAIVSEASLIVADEPTPGLDPKSLTEMIGIFKALSKRGKGIMLITHDIESALKIADKVVVFQNGETIEEAKVEQFSGNGEKLQKKFTKTLWNALPGNTFIPVKKKQEVHHPVDELRVEQISYKYKNSSYLFRNVDFSIKAGEFVGLHGYSGAGKTTMAQVIAGYIKPIEGLVTVNGSKINDFKVNPIQLVWQHPEQAINPRWKMKKVLDEMSISEEILTRVGIRKEWLTRYPHELSGGELQRFCIARALNENTKYLIADEMTTMLDTVTQADLWQLVIQLTKEKNIGVLAISHNQRLLERISDRVVDFGEISNV